MNLSWPWTACEPSAVQCVASGNAVSTLIWDFFDLKPSNCRINHRHAMQLDACILGRIRVLLAKRMATNEINAWGVPRDAFDVRLDRHLATLDVPLFQRLAYHAGLASAFDLGSWSNECAM